MANAELGLILHKIRVKLYPSYLQNSEGAFIARTNNQKVLSIEDLCSMLKTRGGFIGNYDDLVMYVRQYYKEVAYQLCDGFAINNGYYSIYPNVGGTFGSVNEAYDSAKHPISFRFGIRSLLRELVKKIEVEVERVPAVSGYIERYTDFEEASQNSLFVPGNQFAIHGHKIKLVGDDPTVGLYFIPEDDPSNPVKVMRIAENTGSKITGIAPETNSKFNRIEIRTQYAGTNTLLKKPKIMQSDFSLEAVA
jgi:hypothetical protein